MGVAYSQTGSSLVHGSSNGIWKTGERCPDIYLTSVKARKSQRLYTIVSYGQVLILSIGGSQDSSFVGKDKSRLLTILPTRGCGDGRVDDTCTFMSDYVVPGKDFVVVVRPDLYIGYVGDIQGAHLYAKRIA